MTTPISAAVTSVRQNLSLHDVSSRESGFKSVDDAAEVRAAQRTAQRAPSTDGSLSALGQRMQVETAAPQYATKIEQPTAVKPAVERDASGQTALHRAVLSRDLVKVEAVLAGAPHLVNEPDSRGGTPLIAAVSLGQAGIARELLKHASTEVDLANADGKTALMLAIARRNPQLVELLLSRGADPLRECKGVSAMTMAEHSGNAHMVAQLQKAAAENAERAQAAALEIAAPLEIAVLQKQVDVPKEAELAAVDRPSENSELNANPVLALEEACASGNVEVVRALLQRNGELGIDSPFRMAPGDLHNAVSNAAARGKRDILNLLSSFLGAQINHTGIDGTNALIDAAATGRLGAVRLLLECGALDPRAARTSDGATALFLAAANGHIEIVKLFLERPDRIKLAALSPDRWGATPSAIAADNGHEAIVRLLAPFTRPPAGPIPPSKIVTNDAQFHAFAGSKLGDGGHDAALAAARNRKGMPALDAQLQFVGGPSGLSWNDFVQQARSGELAGSRCLLTAHGKGRSELQPRHMLRFNEADLVGTNEAIRLLLENGVRKIDVFSCYCKQAAEHLALRIEHDASWPQVGESVEITFHGEAEVVSASMLLQIDRQRMISDAANPGSAPLFEKLAVGCRTQVTFDAGTRKTSTQTWEAPLPHELAARLRQLEPDTQSQLDFLGACLTRYCAIGDADSVAQIFERFGDLVDPNFRAEGSPWSPLAATARSGRLDIVEILLKQPGIDHGGGLGERHGQRSVPPLAAAAEKGKLAVVSRLMLLPHSRETIDEALATARAHGRTKVHDLLMRHLQTESRTPNL